MTGVKIKIFQKRYLPTGADIKVGHYETDDEMEIRVNEFTKRVNVHTIAAGSEGAIVIMYT